METVCYGRHIQLLSIGMSVVAVLRTFNYQGTLGDYLDESERLNGACKGFRNIRC